MLRPALFGLLLALPGFALPGFALPGLALAQPAAPPAPGSTATPAFANPIPNIPGKSLIAVLVRYEPGARSPPHRHAASAFITAYVLTGAVRSAVDAEEPRVYRAGESFSEAPGAHHRVSENASATEPASLLAIFVVDTNEAPLTIPDRR